MSLPEFPTDDGTLDLIMMALDPGPEATRTSLSDLLDLMSQLGGSDTTAIEEVLHLDPRDDDPYDSRGDQPDWGPEVHVMRDPVYHEHDVIRALIKELRETRREVDDKSDVGHMVADAWELAYNGCVRQINAVMAIDPADYATASRDYGRGFADAIRRVREALEADGV